MAFSGKALVQGVKENLFTAELVNLARIATPLSKDEKNGFFWHGSALQQRVSGLGKAFNEAGLEGNTGKYAGMAVMGATVAGSELINEKIAEKQGGVMGGITRGVGIGAALMDTINLRQYARFAAPLAKKLLVSKVTKMAGEAGGAQAAEGIDKEGMAKFEELMNSQVQRMGSNSKSISDYHDHIHGSLIRPGFAMFGSKGLSEEAGMARISAAMDKHVSLPEHLDEANMIRNGLFNIPGSHKVSAHPGASTGQAGNHKVA